MVAARSRQGSLQLDAQCGQGCLQLVRGISAEGSLALENASQALRSPVHHTGDDVHLPDVARLCGGREVAVTEPGRDARKLVERLTETARLPQCQQRGNHDGSCAQAQHRQPRAPYPVVNSSLGESSTNGTHQALLRADRQRHADLAIDFGGGGTTLKSGQGDRIGAGRSDARDARSVRSVHRDSRSTRRRREFHRVTRLERRCRHRRGGTGGVGEECLRCVVVVESRYRER